MAKIDQTQKTKKTTKIVFVYNADSGIVNGLFDSLHKTFRPKTYSCNLCALTYGLTSMKKDWKQFLDSLPYEITFLHRDEFKKHYPDVKVKLPAILLNDIVVSVLVSAKELNQIKNLDELTQVVAKRLPGRKSRE